MHSLRTSVFLSLVGVGLLACHVIEDSATGSSGTSSSSSSGGQGGMGGGASSSSSSSGGGGDGPCLTFDGASYLVKPSVSPDPNDKAPIYKIATDGMFLYYNTVKRLFKVPVAGGTPMELASCKPEDVGCILTFELRANDILVRRTGLARMSKTGAGAVDIAGFANPSLYQNWTADQKFAYTVDAVINIGEPHHATFTTLDTQSGVSQTILQEDLDISMDGLAEGEPVLHLLGDTLVYRRGIDASSYRLAQAKLPTGPETHWVVPGQVADVDGARGNVFFTSTQPPALGSTLYRLDGPEAVPQVVVQDFTLLGIFEAAAADKGVVFRSAEDVWYAPDGGTGHKVACFAVEDGAFTVHGFVSTGTNVYVTFYRPERGPGIAVVPLH